MLLKELEEEVTYLYHPDHLGSVSVVSNHRGLPYERVEYLPFGEVWIEETDPATGYIPFRFTSKELDEETGLYYHGARYYEPTISRWMSADPAGWELINPMERDDEGGWKPKASYSIIEASNWYAYVSNNPVIYVDPTGEWQFKFAIGRVIAFKFRVYGDNQGNWDVDFAAGLGLGGGISFDIGPVEVEEGVLSVELSYTGEIAVGGREASVDLDVVLESDSPGEWTSQTDAKISVPDPNLSGSAFIEYDVQEGFDSGFEMNDTLLGGENMFFFGIGQNLDEW